MKSLFSFNKDLCTACGACLLACIDQNDMDLEDENLIYRKVFSVEEDENIEYYSLACLHCTDALCMDNCPKKCFEKEKGFVILNNKNCIGCRKCEKVCEFDALSFDKDNKANKCNGCIERVENNLEPACVRVCPTGALSFK